jgi:hypothetical protein
MQLRQVEQDLQRRPRHQLLLSVVQIIMLVNQQVDAKVHVPQ